LSSLILSLGGLGGLAVKKSGSAAPSGKAAQRVASVSIDHQSIPW
jgi:hypothetical protein